MAYATGKIKSFSPTNVCLAFFFSLGLYLDSIVGDQEGSEVGDREGSGVEPGTPKMSDDCSQGSNVSYVFKCNK